MCVNTLKENPPTAADAREGLFSHRDGAATQVVMALRSFTACIEGCSQRREGARILSRSNKTHRQGGGHGRSSMATQSGAKVEILSAILGLMINQTRGERYVHGDAG